MRIILYIVFVDSGAHKTRPLFTQYTLCRLLESIEMVAESVSFLENETEPVTILQTSFAISIQQVQRPSNFSGLSFSANVPSNEGQGFSQEDLIFGESNRETNPAATLTLPEMLLTGSALDSANSTRIVLLVFLKDSGLFLRRNNTATNHLELGEVILSAEVVDKKVERLDPPITLTFSKIVS